jgi:uncharacterized protein
MVAGCRVVAQGARCTVPAMEIVVRVYGELVDLVGSGDVEVAALRRRSVKDLVESIGIPHVEVGLLRVDGEAAGFERQVAGGERVAVYPPFHPDARAAGQPLWPDPPDPRRFVVDVHLGTLSRRLRLLGFDAWYRAAADDDELASIAVADERILLTRDRQLLMRRGVVHGYCPRADDPAAQLLEVARRYELAERLAPLTRCVTCSGKLVPVAAEDVREQVPPRSRDAFDRFSRCGACGQVFWPGSHLTAIDAIVARIVDLRDT